MIVTERQCQVIFIVTKSLRTETHAFTEYAVLKDLLSDNGAQVAGLVALYIPLADADGQVPPLEVLLDKRLEDILGQDVLLAGAGHGEALRKLAVFYNRNETNENYNYKNKTSYFAGKRKTKITCLDLRPDLDLACAEIFNRQFVEFRSKTKKAGDNPSTWNFILKLP